MIVSFVAGAPWLTADTVQLRDGKVIEGTFVGGSARNVEILTASGQSLKLPIDGIRSLNFSQASAAPAAPVKQAAAPASRAL
jgi:hypothetical protein